MTSRVKVDRKALANNCNEDVKVHVLLSSLTFPTTMLEHLHFWQ